MVLTYEELLESDEFSLTRLKEGDILPTLEEISIQRIDKEYRSRMLLGTIVGAAAACFTIKSEPPFGILFVIVFSVAVYQLIGNLAYDRRDDNCDITPNVKLQELANQLWPIVNQHREELRKLRLWISLLIPRIMDGNNFGVEVQEVVKKQINSLGVYCGNFLYALSDLGTKNRAELAYDLVRHPNLKAYKEAIHELDTKEFLNMRIFMSAVRDDANILHDLIMKNIEKIEQPRGDEEPAYNMY
uniref:Proteasome activator PA28 C-terminal domain-containing protein n=1 Tax=Acrobeloides nanus TaxID=290746 RepID=A0A914EB61_9BILA